MWYYRVSTKGDAATKCYLIDIERKKGMGNLMLKNSFDSLSEQGHLPTDFRYSHID